MNSPETAPFSYLIEPAQIRDAREIRITASVDERLLVAESLGLAQLDHLEALLTIRPWRRHGLRIDGDLTAGVGQICSVTMDPIQTEISERLEERLYPEAREKGPRSPEAVIDFEATDDYESFAGETVDLGALIVEYLSLAIDPYPKIPGAAVEPEPTEIELRPPSPFASLGARLEEKASNDGVKSHARAKVDDRRGGGRQSAPDSKEDGRDD